MVCRLTDPASEVDGFRSVSTNALKALIWDGGHLTGTSLPNLSKWLASVNVLTLLRKS